MEVRRAFTSTTPGKRAVQFQWMLFPLLIASAFCIGHPWEGVAGFGAFAIIALKTVMGFSNDDANAKE